VLYTPIEDLEEGIARYFVHMTIWAIKRAILFFNITAIVVTFELLGLYY